jgi:hypothetical protein
METLPSMIFATAGLALSTKIIAGCGYVTATVTPLDEQQDPADVMFVDDRIDSAQTAPGHNDGRKSPVTLAVQVALPAHAFGARGERMASSAHH